MADNPLDDGDSLFEAGMRTMALGETRTLYAKDAKGNILKTFTLLRTDRPYVEDLCAAYNAGRTNDHTEWHVTPTGDLKLRYSAEAEFRLKENRARSAEAERQRWLNDYKLRNRPAAPIE